jgi:hypothetical protein
MFCKCSNYGEIRQTACKPGSVPLIREISNGGDGHSSGTLVTERLVRPTRAATRRFARPPGIPGGLPLLFGLAPGGVFPAAAVTGGAVRSYRTVSPLPPTQSSRGGGGVLSVALSLGSPPPGVTRHRTSVEPGLSSPRQRRRAAIRPSGSRGFGNPRRLVKPDPSGTLMTSQPDDAIYAINACCLSNTMLAWPVLKLGNTSNCAVNCGGYNGCERIRAIR